MDLSPSQKTPEVAVPTHVGNPVVIAAVGEDEVMREQLEDLLTAVHWGGNCNCPDCRRYMRVRAVLLLEVFPGCSAK